MKLAEIVLQKPSAVDPTKAVDNVENRLRALVHATVMQIMERDGGVEWIDFQHFVSLSINRF